MRHVASVSDWHLTFWTHPHWADEMRERMRHAPGLGDWPQGNVIKVQRLNSRPQGFVP